MKLLVVFLFAACVLWFVSGDSQDSPEGLARAVELEAEVPVESEASLLPESELLTVQEAEREVVGVDAQVDAADQADVSSTLANTRFRGTVLVREPSGQLTGGLQGSLKMVLWEGRHGSYVSADIRNGAFELDAGGADHLTVSEVSLQDQGALTPCTILSLIQHTPMN